MYITESVRDERETVETKLGREKGGERRWFLLRETLVCIKKTATRHTDGGCSTVTNGKNGDRVCITNGKKQKGPKE